MRARGVARRIRFWTLLLCAGAAATAQTPARLPRFEAAEIKLNKRSFRMAGDLRARGQLRLTGVPLRALIAAAWQVKERAISGEPSWVDSYRYDVAAKAPPNTSQKDTQLMLRDLLIERFHLAAHNEERSTRLYALVVDKGGPKLRQSQADAASTAEGCSGGRQNGLAHRRCFNTSMNLLAESLPRMSPNYIDLPVVDRTGLAGRYDFDLDWQPKQLQARDRATGPTIFDAVRRLGLKLEPQKLPMTFVVIDRIEHLASEP